MLAFPARVWMIGRLGLNIAVAEAGIGGLATLLPGAADNGTVRQPGMIGNPAGEEKNLPPVDDRLPAVEPGCAGQIGLGRAAGLEAGDGGKLLVELVALGRRKREHRKHLRG